MQNKARMSFDGYPFRLPLSKLPQLSPIRANMDPQGGPGGPQISVPMSEMVVDAGITFSDGSKACYLGIDAVDESLGGSIILGDTFLRSAYVVYDLENQVIALAQAKFNVTDSSVVPIPSGTGLPGVSTTATVAVATTIAGNLTAPVGGPASATATASASGTSIQTGTPTFDLGPGISATSSGTTALGTGSPSIHSGANRTTGVGFGAVTLLAGALVVMVGMLC
jgi:hypothetical protein